MPTDTQLSFLSDVAPRRQVKELATCDQPLTRLSQFGANALSTAELLSLVLGTSDGLDLASELLAQFESLHGLARATSAQIQRLFGVGEKQAARLQAVIELGKRLNVPDDTTAVTIKSPECAANLLMPRMRFLGREELWVVILNTRYAVMGIETVYRGSVNSAAIRIAEVFRPAIDREALAIVVAHNHPSGDPSPSPEDVSVTRELVKAGKLLNVSVVDHIIIGDGRFVSLQERQLGF